MVVRVTPGSRHGRVGTARERVCLSRWRASIDAAPSRRGGGGRDFGGRPAGGNSDIPRDFMKVSVAATPIVHAQRYVLTLSLGHIMGWIPPPLNGI